MKTYKLAIEALDARLDIDKINHAIANIRMSCNVYAYYNAIQEADRLHKELLCKYQEILANAIMNSIVYPTFYLNGCQCRQNTSDAQRMIDLLESDKTCILAHYWVHCTEQHPLNTQ